MLWSKQQFSKHPLFPANFSWLFTLVDRYAAANVSFRVRRSNTSCKRLWEGTRGKWAIVEEEKPKARVEFEILKCSISHPLSCDFISRHAFVYSFPPLNLFDIDGRSITRCFRFAVTYKRCVCNSNRWTWNVSICGPNTRRE